MLARTKTNAHRVPPNCSFEIDDLEKDWTWSKPFDFVFSRVMASCFSDCQAYIDKAYKYAASPRPSPGLVLTGGPVH